MQNELEPCRCGEENVRIREKFFCGIQVECVIYCTNCGLMVVKRTTKKAKDKWNRRVDNAK